MQPIQRRISPRRVALAVLGIGVVYPVVITLAQGYGWRASDWDRDGRTTLSEWFYGMDIGTRQVRVNGQTCTEYFSLKDALPVRVDCTVRA